VLTREAWRYLIMHCCPVQLTTALKKMMIED